MTRKAKLDILDIHPEEQPVEHDPAPAEAKPETPPPGAPAHRKVAVLAAILFAACCLAGGGVFVWLRSGTQAAPPSPAAARAPEVVAAAGRNVVALNNFVIDYPGRGDTVRIAVFALAVELNESMPGRDLANEPNLRGEIYALSKKRSVESLLSPNERGALKSDIAAELKRRLGAGAVKAVYFTEFYIL
jgi:flagellar basal body-associated protein FliL